MDKISLRYVLVVLMLRGGGFLQASSNAVAKPEVAQAAATHYFLNAFEGDQIKQTYIKQGLARYSCWLQRNASAQAGFTRTKRLSVPIQCASLEKIKMCLGALEENDLEKLTIELLDGLDIRVFADLLIYATFLEIDELLLHAGKAFVDQFKEHYYLSFVQQGQSFLDNKVFIVAGKPASYLNAQGQPEPVDWKTIIERLKKQLVQFVLTEKDRKHIRSNLKTTLSAAGPINRCSLSGNYLALSGSNEKKGFCDLISLDDETSRQSLSTELPVQGTFFCSTPLFAVLTSKQLILHILLGKGGSKTLVQVSEEVKDQTIDAAAISTDLSRVALAIGDSLSTVDLYTGARAVLQKKDQSGEHAVKTLCFVPDSPLLVEVRAHGVLRFWNTETGKLLSVRDEHGAEIKKFCCLKDGTVLTISDNGVLIRWDCRLLNGVFQREGAGASHGDGGEQLPLAKKLNIPFTTEFTIESPLCFNETGTKLVLACSEGNGKILDLRELEGGNAQRGVCSLLDEDAELLVDGCYGRDTLLATLSKNNNIFLWNAQTGDLLTTLRRNKPVRLFTFSRNGDVLISGLGEQAVELWYYGSQKIAQYLEKGLGFEQALLLVVWLKNDCKIAEDQPQLISILDTIESSLLGKFLK